MNPTVLSLQDSTGIIVNLQISIVRTNLIIYFFIITVIVAGCSLGSGPIGTSYNNLTAHYNAYFIAKERMLEIENTLNDKYQWNYNKVLPIYVPFDSNDAKSIATQIEDCIEKASIAIQRHPASRWEDDSYVLVGKARYYSLEFADAIETFKYVNKNGKGDDSRHEALIELIKSFVDFGEINNAIAVSDYLKKETLNQKNQKELNLVRAYMFQKREDLNQMVQNLVKAEALMTKFSDRARIDFIIGQVYQHLGFDAEAYNYYKSCLKNNPVYELEFYTKLNMAQVSQLTKTGDLKKIRKYFKKLLKDTKNKEYKDKIYYEMANFEMKQHNLDKAIEFYNESIKTSVKNQRQKAYSYLKLGIIYYDSLRNFELAQAYYDSTVQTMPSDEEDFEKIKQRQEVLDDFVKQITIIRTNDSLINLSQLPKDSLLALAISVVEKQKALEKEKRKKDEQRQANRQTTVFDQQGGDLIGTSLSSDATWYFYNQTAVARGISEFKRVWGNRPLEDNWRRIAKTGGTFLDDERGSGENSEITLDEGLSEEEKLADEANQLLASVPSSEEEVKGLLTEVEQALYKLGNIYNFKLEEKNNAIQTFESLLIRFPTSDYRAELLYQLYLLYKSSHPEIAKEKAQELKSNFPDAIYTKLIDNPNYREDSHATTEQLKKIYTKAYKLYRNGSYKESKYFVDSALTAVPDNVFSDNLALLNVLNMGHLDGHVKYEYELNSFIKTYPTSDVLDYAKNLVGVSENYQINLYNSAKAKFIKYFDQTHYLVVLYPNKDEMAGKVPIAIEDFIKTKNFGLSTGNLVLDQENAMVLINDFPGRSTAFKFLELMNQELNLKELYKGEKINSFVITEDNFDIFYRTKDVSAYLNFFETHYPQ